MNTTRGIVGALLTIVLAAGCAAEPAEPKPAPTPSKAGVWEKTISRLGPDGRLPKDAALDAFTLAVGPLPGVTRPTGEIGGLSTGTIAVSSVLARWQELTEPQRQAVLQALDTKLVAGPPSGGGAIGQRRPGRDPNLACHTKDSPGAEPYRAMLDDAIAKISAKLGRSLTIQPVVTVDTREDPKERS